MLRTFGKYEVSLREEPIYSRNSTDNAQTYNFEYCRSDKFQHVAAHGIVVRAANVIIASAIILGIGGVTSVHKNTLALNEGILYVAAGDSVFALRLPSLKLDWYRKVDVATCFGVYCIQSKNRIITWGELTISCYSIEGVEIWSTSGPDIFTGRFELESESILVTDFNNEKFKINIDTGAIFGEKI